MATTPRSYKKGSYTYTESAPGSNKFQNFTARPTVKKVRDESRDKKAKAAQPVRSKLENAYSPRDRANVKAEVPTISRNAYEPQTPRGMEQRYRPAPVNTPAPKPKVTEKLAPKYGRYDKMAQAEAYRRPVSEEYMTELKRRVGAAGSPLGGLSRWLMRTGDKLFGRY